jgi:Rhomboid-like protein
MKRTHISTRYGFACAYLACFVAVELAYTLLNPDAQARLIAWASTNVANLEHEPAGPLVLSAFVTSGYFVVWPVLIALALFGANRALGNLRTALVCLAGHVIGSLVSEGIVAYRVDAGQLGVANRYLTDVGPSYVVVSAIVIALACGTWPARALAALDLVILVFPGHIFGGLSQLDVSAVGHLTAMITAAAATAFILARRGRGSRGHVSDDHADQVRDRDGAGPQDQLPHRAPPEGPVGQPGHHATADDRGDGGEAERGGHQIQAG